MYCLSSAERGPAQLKILSRFDNTYIEKYEKSKNKLQGKIRTSLIIAIIQTNKTRASRSAICPESQRINWRGLHAFNKPVRQILISTPPPKLRYIRTSNEYVSYSGYLR